MTCTSSVVSQPTHLNNEGKPSSLLDLIFTNTPHLFSSSAEVMAPLATSDHLPVLVECLIAKTSFHPVVGGEYTKWHYALKDVGEMEDAFLYDNWEYVFQPYNNINEIWSRWKSAFFNDIESFIPKSTRKSKKKSLVITLVLEEASLPNPSKKSTIQKSTSIWKPWPLEDLLLSKKQSDSSNKTSQTNSL